LKICEILEKETSSKSYKAHKYSLDATERPTIDYGSTEIVWKKMAESKQYTKHRNLKNLCGEVAKRNDQILTYFLDGSRMVFKVDDQAYHDGTRAMIYPIVAGQLGVGCCKRMKKKMLPEKFKQEFVLSVPDVAKADRSPGFFEAVTQSLNESDALKRLNIRFNAILPYKTSKDGAKKDVEFVDLGTACVQDRMIEGEKELVAKLVREGKLGQDNYLVKDGSLEYKPTKEDKKDKKAYQTFKNNYTWVLGVSKNFNPSSCIDHTKKPNPGFIADLQLYDRTPVACYENQYLGDIQFAVWYVRIRDKDRTRTPFDGILKVEKILATPDDIVDSEEVDLLSAHLINERVPTCYGSDSRWANHLYPIYLTEFYVKSRYLSTESFLNLF
jgi:hypothetical protein